MSDLIIETDSSIATELESIIFPWMTIEKDGNYYTIEAQVKIKDIPEELRKGWNAEWLLQLMWKRRLYWNLNPPELKKQNQKFRFGEGCWVMLRVGDLVSIKFEKIKGEIVEFKNNRILIFDYKSKLKYWVYIDDIVKITLCA